MPWQYPENVPPSMKYLKPSIQKKAIAIANHVLTNTGDEGKSIAIGIAKAKKVHDKKGLVKLAASPWATFQRKRKLKKLLKAIEKNDAEALKNIFIPGVLQ